MNKELLKINYIFSNNNGTTVSGQMLLPLIDGVVYKPTKIIVSKGYLDLNHKKLSGKNSEKNRIKKDKILKKYTSYENNIKAKIIKPFILSEKPMGIVAAISVINGFNSNRQSMIFFDEENTEFNSLKVAQFFQNLKTYSEDTNALEVISLNEAQKKYSDYFQNLKKYYHMNSKSSSTTEIEVK